MRVFNYSEAKQNFAALLARAVKEEVIITKQDGSRFKIVPLTKIENRSPFDVPGIKSKISAEELFELIREVREMS